MHELRLILLLLIPLAFQVKGQDRDEASRIYILAANEMLLNIQESENINKVIFWGDDFILEVLPDSLGDIELIKSPRLKSKRKYDGIIWIELGPAYSTDDGGYQLFCTIRKQKKNFFIAWEAGISGYQLEIGYGSDLGNLKVFDTKKSIIIR